MSDKKDNAKELIKGLGKVGKKAAKLGWSATKFGLSVGASTAKIAGKAIYSAGTTVAEKIAEARDKVEVIEDLEAETDVDAAEATKEDTLISSEEPEVEEPAAEEPVTEEPAEEPVAEEPAEEPVEEPAEEPAPKHERAEDKAKDAKQASNKKKLRIAAGILGVLILGGAGAYASVADETKFANNVVVDGVNVSQMTEEEAALAFTDNLNTMTIKCDDGEEQNLQTSFIYANPDGVNALIKLSHLDIRKAFGAKELNYNLKLNTSEGIDQTAATLNAMYPLAEGETRTQDAHIDYDKMSIVDAVQGSNIDCTALSEAIAEQRCKEPTRTDFEFAKEDYIDVPDITAADLEKELEFAKEYLAPGLDIEDPNGKTVHASAKQLSNVILFDGNGPDYSKEGAAELARVVAKDYKSDIVKINTQEGEKTLNNYAIAGAIDPEKSAESIIEAAKNGGKAKVYADDSKTAALGDHVEVSISNQTLYLVQNNEVTYKSPVVTGNYGHDTPKGVYKVAWKASPATLSGKNDDGSEYNNPVSFWMPFNGGIGLHDAPWRGVFGGRIYRGNGSHGCVNLPYATAKKVYSVVSSGYVVVVY